MHGESATSRIDARNSLTNTNAKRTNMGWLAWFDIKAQERIHQLIHRYGIENIDLLPPRQFCNQCDFCKEFKDVRDYDLEPTERESSSPSTENTGDS
jgi:hypothetical protein